MNSSQNEIHEGEIPKFIWQTYKSSDLPFQAKNPIESWYKNNPEYQWYFMDDARCEQFIVDHFNDEFVDMYKSLPYGVMKSDVWRVAVVYVYGGLYVDTDCVCMQPLNTWINSNDKLILSQEHPNGDLCNYAFAATPKHPALKSVLETFLHLYKSPGFLDKNTSTPIQNFGQFGFTNGILKYHNTEKSGTKIFTYEERKFVNFEIPDSYIWHQVASFNWKDNYDSWRKRQAKDFGRLR
jgi:mannosyltransferase OCH1-like enzyme